MPTLDEQLVAQGYRVIATFDRMELFERVSAEIPNLATLDYFILPVHMALGQEPIGPAYDGLHRIYVKER